MASRLRAGFLGGTLGALVPAGVMTVRTLLGGPLPLFIKTYRHVFGRASLPEAAVIGGLLFVLSGGAWGALFGEFVSDPSPARGLVYGIAPAFWVFVVVAPVMLDQPIFFGFAAPEIIPPLLFNCLLWGVFVGWFMQRAESPS